MKSLQGCSGGGWTMVMKIDGNKVSCYIVSYRSCTAKVAILELCTVLRYTINRTLEVKI